MARFTRKQIEDVYRTHPLRIETILRRLRQTHESLEGVTEVDLAEDPLTEITDQNHLGGVAFTREMAERTSLSPSSRVLDLGCGLGGSARVLAWFHGCRVHGLDLSPERIEGARALTRLVGLDHLVTFECADVLDVPVPVGQFDVLWGQSSWTHLERKSDFLRKWIDALTVRGKVALEDVYLRRLPTDDAERRLIGSLEDHWTSELVTVDGDGGWRRALEIGGFTTLTIDDLSGPLLAHFDALRTAADRPESDPVSSFERKGWQLGIQAVEAGLIGYFRAIASKPFA